MVAAATFSGKDKDWLSEDRCNVKSIVDFINNSTFQSPDAAVIA
jgi:hypothetical protein